jgi:hypothetical protein
MDDLRAGRLQNTPHDVDRGVMAIKQAGGSNEAQAVLGLKTLLGGGFFL